MKLMNRAMHGSVASEERWSRRSIWMLGCFAAAAVAMGGGSRYDVASVPFLRAFAIFLTFAIVAVMPSSNWRGLRVPLLLIVMLALWMCIQLLPLPSEIWSTLPLRAPILAMDQLLSAPDRWRPISLAPAFTWNSLLSLCVPLAAILIAGTVQAGERIRIWWTIWACALASAAFGMLQFMAGPRSAFYLFRITNEGALVGLFANRNHHAVLLAIGILAAGWLVANEATRRNPKPLLIPALIGSIVTFLLLIFAIGSRTGLVCGMGGALLAYGVIRRSYRFKQKQIIHGRSKQRVRQAAEARSERLKRGVFATIPFFLIGALTALFYLSDRGNSVTRLFGSDTAEDGRVQTLAPILSLLKEQWLLGSGFGSFARVYQIIEPDALLQEAYLNHAHNDWLQLPIEGGVPGALIFIVGMSWISFQLVRSWRDRSEREGAKTAEVWVLAAAFVVLAAGSMTDYPLRAPSMAMVAMFLVVILIRHREDVCDSDAPVNSASI